VRVKNNCTQLLKLIETKHGYHLLLMNHIYNLKQNMATAEMLMVPREIWQFMHYKLQMKLDYMASTQAEVACSSVLNKIISTQDGK